MMPRLPSLLRSALARLSIRQKLLGAFAVDLALMAGLGLFALGQMESMNRQASLVEDRTIPSLRNVDHLRGLVTRYRSHQLEYLILTSDADRARLQRAMAAVEQQVDLAAARQLRLMGGSKGEDEAEGGRGAWRHFVDAWARYRDANERQYLPAVRRTNTGSVQPALSRLNPLYDELQRTAEHLAQLGEERATAAAETVQARYRVSRLFILGDTTLSLVVSAVFGLALAATLSRRLRTLHAASGRVADGDLDTRTDLADLVHEARAHPAGRLDDEERHRGDELTDLARQFDRMVVSLRKQRATLEERNDELQASLRAQKRLTHDLVERTEAEEAAVRAHAEAEAASSAKSFFLATMSHELRTPLNAILGYAQVMAFEAEARGDVAHAGDIDRIQAAGRHLLTLISNVLDFSKIEQGKMDVEVVDFDLRQIVGEVADILRPTFDEGGNRLHVEGLDERAAPMSSDPSKVRQVLFNLLSNAAKFTHDGDITVRVDRCNDERGDLYCVEVRDTGIGIEPELMAQLFEPYRQADLSIRRRFGGTGLGLVVSRKLCRLLDGELQAESRVGEGSRFTAVLPARLEFDPNFGLDSGLDLDREYDPLPDDEPIPDTQTHIGTSPHDEL